MAVADSALFGIESLDDLQKLEIPPGEEELILGFKESALDRPILRKCTKEKGTTEEKMPKKAFLRIFAAMMKKAGYFVERRFMPSGGIWARRSTVSHTPRSLSWRLHFLL